MSTPRERPSQEDIESGFDAYVERQQMSPSSSHKTGAHTELPWAVSECEIYHPGSHTPVALALDAGNGEANAAFIVQAVNSHDDLVAALQDAREFVQMNVDELLASCCITGPDGKPDRSTIDHMDKVAIDDAEGCLAKIDAALTKASAS